MLASIVIESESVALWVFGYGSIIWRPNMPYVVAHWATADGWSRRFWQGSHDHRGTKESPGRVLTLVPYQETQCIGRVFGIGKPDVERVLVELDHREKNGYERQQLSVVTKRVGSVNALTYIATPTNPAWLGDATDYAIAEQIKYSSGPSGSNKAYVLELYRALQEQKIHDEHVHAIAKLLT